MDLYEFLQYARDRPGMYVRDWSLDELETICRAYSTALTAHDIKEFGTHFNEEFCEFLLHRYGWSMCQGWARGIRARFENDQAAFCRFFELLEKFRERSIEPDAAGD